MYIIGNADTHSNVPMWSQVIGMLRAADWLGETFPLFCPRHPNTELQVRQPGDFDRLSPEGGCHSACDRRLPDCGHRCLARCHSDALHKVFSCPQPCQRLLSCGHNCQKPTCGEDCGKCMIKLSNVKLPCGHFVDGITCYRKGDLNRVTCKAPVRKRILKCSHEVEVGCLQDVNSKDFKCPSSCGRSLKCGHGCLATCGQCDRTDGIPGFDHPLCQKICDRPLPTCNHRCPERCHGDRICAPCTVPCEVSTFRISKCLLTLLYLT